MGLGDSGGRGHGRPRRYFGVLTPEAEGVVQGLDDVDGGKAGEGSAVPDVLHPGI